MKRLHTLVALGMAAVVTLGAGVQAVHAAGTSMVMRMSEDSVDSSKETVFNYYGQKVAKKAVKDQEGTLAVYKAVDEENPTENYLFALFKDAKAQKKYVSSKDMQGFYKAVSAGVTPKGATNGTPFYVKEIKVPLYTMGIADTKIVNVETFDVQEGQTNAVKSVLLNMEHGVERDGQTTKGLGDSSGLYATYMVTMEDAPDTIKVIRVFANSSASDMYNNSAEHKELLEGISSVVKKYDEKATRVRVSYNKGGLTYNTGVGR